MNVVISISPISFQKNFSKPSSFKRVHTVHDKKAAVISDNPLSKSKNQLQKLESRKTLKQISYKIPSLREVQIEK